MTGSGNGRFVARLKLCPCRFVVVVAEKQVPHRRFATIRNDSAPVGNGAGEAVCAVVSACKLGFGAVEKLVSHLIGGVYHGVNKFAIGLLIF